MMSVFNERMNQLISSLLVASLALMASCQPACDKMEPIIVCPFPVEQISTLPSPFPPLSTEELEQEWAKELLIGDTLARELDLYRAITCYKRALVLIPVTYLERRLQIDYNILLAYYLGNKCQEAIDVFETTPLAQANPQFPAFNHLLLIVFDSYRQVKQDEKAACVLEAIQKYSPETADDLSLYLSLKQGNLDKARSLIATHRDADEMQASLALYDFNAKSPRKARLLNAILPGAGYYYVGQRNSAITSFIINALFIAASYECFRHGYPAAGLITASLEAGWYFGGINGAGIEANEYNTRLFEGVSQKILTQHACFPILMFEASF